MYQLTERNLWRGRIDSLTDKTSFRWHQLIQLVDLYAKDVTLPLAKNNYALLGFCCDEGIRRNQGRTGASQGPDVIRKFLASLPVHFGEDTSLIDAGNVLCTKHDMEQAQEQLSELVDKLLAANYLPLILGGGHEIAYGHFKGIAKFLSKKNTKPSIGIINFDAHFDLRPFEEQGNSGTPFLQIAQDCQKGNIPFNYFCVGIQALSNTRQLFQTAEDLGVTYVPADQVNLLHFNILQKKIADFIQKNEYIYLSIDLDVFSAAFAPGVSAPNPVGVSPEIILQLLHFITGSGKLISVDIAEFSPEFDSDNRTAKLATALAFDIVK